MDILQAFVKSIPRVLAQVVASFKIGYVCFRIHGLPARKPPDLGRAQGYLRRLGNVPRDLPLSGEDVARPASICFGQ